MQPNPNYWAFWSKYRSLFPQHELWAEVDSGRKPLTHCLPLYLHGDEGVTYRKDGLLVVSFQGVWGHGSSKTARLPENYKATSSGIPLNFLLTGFQTRILICVTPKECLWKINFHIRSLTLNMFLCCMLHARMPERCMILQISNIVFLVIVLANPIIHRSSMHAWMFIYNVKSIHGKRNDDIYLILDSMHAVLLAALHRSFTKTIAGCGMPSSSRLWRT